VSTVATRRREKKAGTPPKPCGRALRLGWPVVEPQDRPTHGDRPFAATTTTRWMELWDETVHGDPGTRDPDASLPPDRVLLKADDHVVRDTIRRVEAVGLPQWFDRELAARRKGAGGQRARFTPLSVLVAFWLLANHDRPLLLTDATDLLLRGVSDESRELLGVRAETHRVPLAARHKASRAATLGQAPGHQSADSKFGAALRRMLDLADPSPLPKNRIMSHGDLAAAARPMTDDQRHTAQANLDWICNLLLEITYNALPRAVRRRWKGAGCIDATPISAYARIETAHRASSDPDAGTYSRTKTALGKPVDKKAPGKVVVKITKREQMYDAHLFVAGDDQPGERQYVPGVTMSMTLDRPAVDPAGNTRRLLANLASRGHAPGPATPAWLAMDRLYMRQSVENFQAVLPAFGWRPVTDYGDDALGVQANHPSGAVLIEGNWYCPAILAFPDLVNATADYRRGDIDKATWLLRIQQRQTHRMRTKNARDDTGAGRLRCPADGGTEDSLAVCENKPDSKDERRTRQKDGTTVDARPTIIPEGPAFLKIISVGPGPSKPTVCSAGSVAITAADGMKYEQQLTYGTPEMTSLYKTLRSSQEGEHGFAKDTARNALDEPQRRRVRGKAAQSFLVAFIIAAANMRKIASFVAKQIAEGDGDEQVLYVLKQARKADHDGWAEDNETQAFGADPPAPG